MTRVSFSKDCGNSPKNKFVQKLTIALAKGDSKFILNKVTDDIHWNIVGDQIIEGKSSFTEVLEKTKKDQAAELKILHIATHGKMGAVDGTTKSKHGKQYAFCDVFGFSNAKGDRVKEIISYVIEIDS